MPNLSGKILTAVLTVTMAVAPTVSQALTVKSGIGSGLRTYSNVGVGASAGKYRINTSGGTKSTLSTTGSGGVSTSKGGLQFMVPPDNGNSSRGTSSGESSHTNTSGGAGANNAGGSSGGVSTSTAGLQGMVSASDSGHTNTSVGAGTGNNVGAANGNNSGSGVSTSSAGYKGLPGQDNQSHTNTSTGAGTGSGSTDSNNDNTGSGVSTSSPDYKGLPGQDDQSHTNTSTGVSTTDDGYKGLPGTDDGNGGHGESACSGHYYPHDIDGHWAEIYIRRLYDLCIIEGYSDGTFRPNHDITRAELVKMSLYSKGIKPNLGCYDNDCGSPFMDLDRWQSQWIRPAWDRKIVQGYSHDQFRPNKAVTRAEAVKIILATYGYGPLNVGQSFFNDVNGWSVGWIEKAHEIGLVQGVGNGNFDPNRPITRAEAAKVISKMMEYWDTLIR